MDQYGSDFITIVDEDGTEYELEVLSTLEYNGETYLAVIPAGESADEYRMEVSILKDVEENGESILCAIEDEAELQAVYDLIMDSLYEEEDEDFEEEFKSRKRSKVDDDEGFYEDEDEEDEYIPSDEDREELWRMFGGDEDE